MRFKSKTYGYFFNSGILFNYDKKYNTENVIDIVKEVKDEELGDRIHLYRHVRGFINNIETI